MKNPRFRSLPKEFVPGEIPVPIADIIRIKAAKERRSHASVTTEILCKGLGLDPSKFGIEELTSSDVA
jgi:hypothetical protein